MNNRRFGRAGSGGPLAAVLALAACSPAQPQAESADASASASQPGLAQHTTLQVRATLDGEPFSCDDREGAVMTPSELMLFLHDFQWVLADGSRLPAPLADDGLWQTSRVALLDFAGDAAGCADASAAQNEELVFQGVPPADAAAIAFHFGVPFDLNHADPTTNSGPLTLMQMHWGWRGGYKFIRLEGESLQGPVLLHLGSTGCVGPMMAVERCEHGGQVEAQITWLPGTTLGIELVPLLDQSLLEGHRCMGLDSEGLSNCSTAWTELSAARQDSRVWGSYPMITSGEE
jgi:uncharacterized repeat protein (TIGR04052 family)